MSQDRRTSAENFIEFALKVGVIKISNFKTKAGRDSPYFCNAGLFTEGADISTLAGHYAMMMVVVFKDNIQGAVLFGPAYKGIGLAYAIAVELSKVYSINVSVAYDRKEVKDHGEGGSLVGAVMKGRKVIIVEDVISSAMTTIASAKKIADAGGTVVGCAIMLDRQETAVDPDTKEESNLSGTQQFTEACGAPVYAIAKTSDLISVLEWPESGDQAYEAIPAIRAYLERYSPKA